MVGAAWLLSSLLSIRQVYEWFMITVRASVLFLWSTQIYATVYLLVVNVDYTDYETVLAAFGFILWVILNLIW